MADNGTRRLPPLTVFVAVLAMAQLARSQPAKAESSEVGRFLRQLQSAVARRDKPAVARLVRYPITITIPGLPPVPVRNAAQMVEYYDAFFARELRCVIADSGIAGTTPRPRQPVRLSTGVAVLGRQIVVVERGQDGYKITRLGVPPPVGTRPRPLERVMFRAGEKLARMSGALATGQRHVFVVYLREGQVARVGLEAVKATDAVVTVLDSDGKLVDPGAGRVRTWSGRITTTGDYRIEVLRTAHECDPAVLYKLNVTLR